MSAVPLRVLEFSSYESNSVQSLQFSSLLLSRRLCIFHLPTKKSKSLGDDVVDAVIFKSPFSSKLNLGIGKLGSVVRTVVCARAKLQMWFARARSYRSQGTEWQLSISYGIALTEALNSQLSTLNFLPKRFLVHDVRHFGRVAAVVAFQHIDQSLDSASCHTFIGID